MSLDHFELRIMELEQRLRPIADRPVDITKPGWVERLKQAPQKRVSFRLLTRDSDNTL